MSRDKVLPPKLSIKQIQSYLDMNIFSEYSPSHQLCDHVNEKDFELILRACEFDIYEQTDATMGNGTLQISTGSTPLTSITGDCLVATITHNEPPSIFDDTQIKPYSVTAIRNQGIEYHITEHGSLTVGAEFDESDLYGHRDHIIDYRKQDLYKDTLDQDMLGVQPASNHYSSTLENTLSPHLDPDHENYPEELHVAIQAHKAVIINKHGNQRLNRVDRVENWINTNKSDLNLSTAAINRIAAIIGPTRIKRK